MQGFCPTAIINIKSHFHKSIFCLVQVKMRRFVGKNRFDLWCLSQLWVPRLRPQSRFFQECLGYIGRFLNQSMKQVQKEISLEFWLRDSEASLCLWRVWITHSPSVPGFILTFCSLSILLFGESLSLPHESLFVVFSCVTWAWSDGQRDSLSPPTACAVFSLSFWTVSSRKNCIEAQSRSYNGLVPRECSWIFLGL